MAGAGGQRLYGLQLIFGYAGTAELLARRGAPVSIVEAAGLGRADRVREQLPDSTAEERH